MFCSSSSPTFRRRPGEGRRPRGFTLVELLTVMLILAILIALLLPAINSALRTAKNAAVGSEINQLAQALNAFKSKYGDYPPSRIYLSEDGNLTPAQGGAQIGGTGSGDITYAQLGQRSLAAMRKFFPRVPFNSGTNNYWFDFNGDGQKATNGVTQQYILSGHECLVFFLGGIPFSDSYPVTANSRLSVTGFGKDPTNPFTNNLVNMPGYSANRQAPFFEFNASRLALDFTNLTNNGSNPGIPGYLDSLGNALGNGMTNFYAYFSAYGNGGYDPNDVNFNEADPQGNGPIELAYHTAFPILPVATPTTPALSRPPNPYTTTLTAPFNAAFTTSLSTTFINPQSFQIISSGVDGFYGVGGQYAPDNTGEALPYDTTASPNSPYVNTTDKTIRGTEKDNVTNFHNGRLE